MAAVKIKTRGAAAKPEPKATAKPKSTTRKTAGAKATTKPKPRGKRGTTAKATPAKATPAKRGPGRPRKAEGAAPVRRDSKGIDAKVEARLLKAVTRAGERRQKAKIEHEESVNALHTAAQEALEGGVSMAKVADSSGISRQWLYKMGDFRQDERGGHQLRANGNGEDKPAAKARSTRKVTAKPAAGKRSTTRRNTKTTSASKPAVKRGRTKIRAAG
jgi:transposase-like protein